jgi:hypothetical protein
MWRTVGFLASFATILHLAALVSFLVIMSGGRLKRESGWKILCGLLLVVAAIEFSVVTIVAYLFENDDQFLVPGWYLDTALYLEAVSAAIAVLCALGLAASRFMLPPEDNYELLYDPVPA